MLIPGMFRLARLQLFRSLVHLSTIEVWKDRIYVRAFSDLSIQNLHINGRQIQFSVMPPGLYILSSFPQIEEYLLKELMPIWKNQVAYYNAWLEMNK